ncbi:MAG: patatin-like phospholipase family protein [Spirochaetaceae bacterium]|jgi:NTE family protein|nr:patatin-like phospholipase family protein [Spirochaetaceae bacterium]
MRIKKNLKWALVLSGGGAKGYAHLGVLNVLEDMGVPRPSLIAGTSMGSIIGGLYAAGVNLEKLKSFVLTEFDILQYLGKTKRRYKVNGPVGWVFQTGQMLGNLATKSGMDSGEGILTLLDRFCEGKKIEEAEIPFRCNAVDLVSGRELVFRSGSIARAARASSSFPAFFEPLVEGGMLLVDGGICNNLPVYIARDEGFKRILAVDVAGFESIAGEKFSNGARILYRTLEIAMHYSQMEKRNRPSLLINAADDTSPLSFDKAGHLIELGEKAARERLRDLEKFFSGRRLFKHRMKVRDIQ